MTVIGAHKKVSSDHKPFAAAGYALIAFGLGGFMLWTSTAQIAAAVVAPGTVSVVSNRKTIQHLEGGIVDEVLVRDGSQVAAGDILLRLGQTSAKAGLDVLTSQLDGGLADEARLTAERDELDAIPFPSEFQAREGEPALRHIVDSQEQLFAARRQSADRQVQMLDSRIESLRKRADAYARQIGNLTAEIASFKEQRIGVSSLASKGFAPKNSERELDRQIFSVETAISEAEGEVATAESGIAESQLEKVMVGYKLREEAMDELAKARETNAGLVERIAVARDVLERTNVRAPQDGIVQGLRVHAKGAVVRPGDPIMEMVPVEDDLIVEMQLASVSVDEVHKGMIAEIRFPSFPSRTTPILLGKVMSISPDALPDAEGKRLNFAGRVEVLDNSIPKELAGRLHPGMPAEVIISTEERTVLAYLVKPLLDAVSRTFRER